MFDAYALTRTYTHATSHPKVSSKNFEMEICGLILCWRRGAIAKQFKSGELI